MGSNLVERGDFLTLTAPSGGVVGGDPKLVGNIFGVVENSADEGDIYSLRIWGVVKLSKVAASAGQAVDIGDFLYWDASVSKLTPVPTGGTPVAIATKEELSTATTVNAHLLGKKLGETGGKIVEMLAPSGGVTVNTPIIIGSLFVIPLETKAEGVACKFQIGGLARLAKVSADTIDPGQKVYWNTSSNKVTETATAAWKIGASLETAGNGVLTVLVNLDGIQMTVEAG